MNVGEFALAIAAGSLTTLSPCVLPMIPVVVGGALQANRYAPLAIGAGMVLSFTVLGVLLGALGSAIGLTGDSFRTAGAVMLVLFGAVMLVPSWNARFASWLSPVASAAGGSALRGDSLAGAVLLGATLGMVWTPCSGPLLGSTLALVASDGGALRGGMLLAFFGVGAALPLVTLAYLSRAGFRSVRDALLARVAAWRTAFAVLLLVIGVGILTGLDKRLEATLLDLMPESWILLTVRF